MYKFRVLVQNKNASKGVYYFRNGYIKANTDQEAEQNLNTIFSGFNFTIDHIKPCLCIVR